MEAKTDDKPCMKSEDTNPGYVADYDSCNIKMEKTDIIKQENDFERTVHHCSVEKNEHWDGVNQVKMENQLVVEVKSEKPVTEPTMDNLKFENMDSLVVNEQIDIKSEYNEDPLCNLKWDRIKEGHTVDQLEMEFQESEKLEDLRSANFENMDAVGLHEEFEIKTESDQSDGHDSASNSAQIRKTWKREHKCSQIEEEKKLFGSVSCKIYGCTAHAAAKARELFICKHCNTLFKKKQSLFDHILKKHPKFSGTIPSKIYECMHCGLKKTRRYDFIQHMAKHNTQRRFECIKCKALLKTKTGLDNHIVRKHHELTASLSRKIHECPRCQYKTTFKMDLYRHMMKHTGAKLKCIKCDASFMRKQSLDDHTLKKHPGFTTSVSHKIHECTHCQYKTTCTRDLCRHKMKHTGAKLTCTKCDMSFTSQRYLDNHIRQKHPKFTASVSSKIHCEYKTVEKSKFSKHVTKHAQSHS